MAAAATAKTIVVAEMNYAGQLAGEVSRVVGNSVKLKRVNTFNGEVMFPQAVLEAIQEARAASPRVRVRRRWRWLLLPEPDT